MCTPKYYAAARNLKSCNHTTAIVVKKKDITSDVKHRQRTNKWGQFHFSMDYKIADKEM